jgi:hypothetical protein
MWRRHQAGDAIRARRQSADTLLVTDHKQNDRDESGGTRRGRCRKTFGRGSFERHVGSVRADGSFSSSNLVCATWF